MGPKIAILLSGFPSDLPVSVCAVQLAARTESELYALQDCAQIGVSHCDTSRFGSRAIPSEEQVLDSFRLVGELAEAEGVAVSYHRFEAEDDAADALGLFLIDHAISCLVIYSQEHDSEAHLAWIDALQKRLDTSPRWFYGTLQVILAPPWQDNELEATISQLQHLHRISGRKEDTKKKK